jgi:hypothetical protein
LVCYERREVTMVLDDAGKGAAVTVVFDDAGKGAAVTVSGVDRDDRVRCGPER